MADARRKVKTPLASNALVERSFWPVLLSVTQLIPAGLLAIFIVLVANPVRNEQLIGRKPQKVTNIQFCLKISNSMLQQRVGAHCRYCAATKAMSDFARGREGDAFGLTMFGTVPMLWVPLSDDVSAIYRAASYCYPDWLPDKVTASADTAAGIRASIRELVDRSTGTGARLLILLTDGEDQAIAAQVETLAADLDNEDVTLFVLLFQNPGSSPALGSIAARTENGGLFDCSSSHDLADVFRLIDSMHKIEYEMSAPTRAPYKQPWLYAAAIMLALQLAMSFGIRYVPC